jgi:hypothetical protein
VLALIGDAIGQHGQYLERIQTQMEHPVYGGAVGHKNTIADDGVDMGASGLPIPAARQKA